MKATQRSDGRWQVRIPAKLSASGKRESRYFPSKSQAEKWVREFRDEHREHGKAAITAEHRRWLGYLLEHVGDLQLLPTIVEFWKRSGQTISQITAADAVKAFCDEAEAEYPNRRTWHDIEERLAKFAKHFGTRPLHEISVAEIESFLSSVSTSGWDRWSLNKRLRPFYKLAARRRWVTTSPMQEIPIPKVPQPKRLIYTPQQLQAMLWECEKNYPTLLPYVVLCAFCYMRTSELVKMYATEEVLQWPDVDLGDDFLNPSEPVIHVRTQVAKSTRRHDDERWIPLSQTAQDWLRPIRQRSGPCVQYSAKKFGELWRAMTDAAGVPRIDNGLRHSAISYSLSADPENAVAVVAKAAGNSESVVHRHYQRSIKRRDAEAWFRMEHWSPDIEEKRKAKKEWIERAAQEAMEAPEAERPDDLASEPHASPDKPE